MIPPIVKTFLGLGRGNAEDPEQQRAQARHRRIAITAGTSLLAKMTSIATMLISVPLTLHYLGGERYGIWATISSFSLMLAFADLGIGNGLLTAISRSSGENDVPAMRGYVSSAAFVLSVIGLAIGLAGLAAMPFVDWAGVFNVHGDAARLEVLPAMRVFLICFALSLPLTLIQRVQLALQRGFLSNLWQCLASMVTLFTVVAAAWSLAPLPWLVAAFLVPPLVVGLLNSLYFFGWQMPSIAPAIRCVSRPRIAEVLKTGGLFFVLQITLSVAFFSDSFLISRVLGPVHVTEYSIADRLFSLVSQLISFAMLPLWPALGEALARKDRAWAWRALVRGSVAAFAVASAASLTLLLAAPFLIRHWVGSHIEVPFALLLGFALWRIIEATAGAPAMYLNALQVVRFQVVCALLMAASAITLKLLLIGRFGIVILPWMTICSYLICSGLPIFIYLRRRRPSNITH